MYNILEELGYNNIIEFINSDEFRKYVENKLLNKSSGEGKSLVSNIMTNTLKLDNNISVMYGESNLKNDIEDYLKDIIRKRKINKIRNDI